MYGCVGLSDSTVRIQYDWLVVTVAINCLFWGELALNFYKLRPKIAESFFSSDSPSCQ